MYMPHSCAVQLQLYAAFLYCSTSAFGQLLYIMTAKTDNHLRLYTVGWSETDSMVQMIVCMCC